MKTVLHRLILTGLIAACTNLALAQTSMVPSAMSYQGLLTDTQGNPVAPSTPLNQNVEFRIYSTATGGTALWGEAQTVTVFKGNFSVILGNGTAIGAPSGAAAFANVFTNAQTADLYFGIAPQGGAEFAPRQKLLSSAFALRAKTAETVNGAGQPASSPAQFNAATVNTLTANGIVKINSGNALELGAGIADKQIDAGKIMYKTYSQGLDIIGAGTTTSNRKLTMWGEGGTDFKGPINFGRYEQSINLFDTLNGVGSQNTGMYLRAYENIAFYKGGVHNDGSLNAGTGGSLMAYLSSSGFTLNTGKFTGDGSGLTNVPIPSTVNNLTLNGSINKTGHGAFVSSFSGAHVFGSQDYTTYTRSSRNFAWYLGGSHADAELNAGGGTRVMTLTSGGLEVNSGGLSVPNASLSFGSHLGQQINLYGTAFGLGIQNNSQYSRSGSSFSWYVGGTHADNENDAGGGSQLANWSNSRLDMYRRVYIGANPTDGQAPLEVPGRGTQTGLGSITEFWHPNTGAGYDGRTNYSTFISIRAGSSIVASNFIATSDLRLKLPEGRSDAAKDLETLGALEVTDYTMKDKTIDGGRKHKKLIAQQLEQVYPQAVSQTRGTVPDIFRVATANDGFIAFQGAGRADLKTGETVRLVQGKSDLTTEVTGVQARGFTVKDTVADGELFVYGHQVDDLRVVDYEAVAMLNVSATQELTRQLQAQTAALSAVQQERDALAQEVIALRKAAGRQEERLASIEEKVAALAGRSAAPVALQVKLEGK
jgi:hypothetical protein